MKHFQLLLAITLFLLAPVVLAAATEYPEQIAERLQRKYDGLNSLSFSFQQQSHGQMSGRPQRGSGTATFVKADGISKMRWDYSEPDQQVLLSDGSTFSMYFAELKQMIVTPADSLENDLTYSFFSGRGRISEKFHILPADSEYLQEDGVEGAPKVIKLIPMEEHSQVQHIHLWVSDDSLIRRIEIRDHFDTITQLNFSSIVENPLAATDSKKVAELFSFTPPAGTEIIEQ